jgi:hypothetical protein
VKETVEKLGGLDIIIANAGWTRFSDFKDLKALSDAEWNKVECHPSVTRIYTDFTVLGLQRHVPSAAHASSGSHIQPKP